MFSKEELRLALRFSKAEVNVGLLLLLSIVLAPMLMSIIYIVIRGLGLDYIASFSAIIFIPSLILYVYKKLQSYLDVRYHRLVTEEVLVAGNFHFDDKLHPDSALFYTIYDDKLKMINLKKIFMNIPFLKHHDIEDIKGLYGCLVKLKHTRLKSSMAVVKIEEFTFIDATPLKLLKDICDKVFLGETYKSISQTDKVFKRCLKQLATIYPNTKFDVEVVSRSTKFFAIKNISENLNKNPRPFLDYLLGEGWEIPRCYVTNIKGEVIREYQMTEAEFAKIAYYNLFEAQKYAPKFIKNAANSFKYLRIG